MNALLYVLTTLIWGTTWLAISLQTGPVAPLTSVFYRFALAGLLFLPVLWLLGKVQKISRVDHLWILLQSLCLYSLNFICFYHAAAYLTSGLVSIIFATAIFFNAANNRVFWRIRPTRSVYIAGVLGVAGLVLLFWQELLNPASATRSLTGIGLSMLGTYFFSLGNMIAVRHKQVGIDAFTSSAYGMNYGALILLLIIWLSGTPLSWDSRPEYVYSLFYLAIPGTIIGFTVYLTLVGRIGANKAAYATVLFPVVALALSSIYEGYRWNGSNVLGLLFVLSGIAFALDLWPRRGLKKGQ